MLTIKFQKKVNQTKQSHLNWFQKTKYIGINMTKEVRDFFADNFEALIKAIKNDSKMWTFIPTLGVEKLWLFNWLYYSMQATDFMVIHIKLTMIFFTKLE